MESNEAVIVNEGRPRLGYRPALDGVRAIAIAFVVLGHTVFFLVRSQYTHWFPSGLLGVDLFFVLSGFLITTLLLERHDEPRPIRSFYQRRILRLMPAVLVLLLVNLGYALVRNEDVGRALQSIPVTLTYTTNWAELNSVNISLYVQHFWSLAVEGQFYLVWPLVIFGALRAGLSRTQMLGLVLMLALAAACWRAHLFWSGEGWLRIYLRTDARADALLIGAALALLPYDRIGRAISPMVRNVLGFGSVALLAAAVQLIQPSSERLYVGGFTAVALLSAVVVGVALQPGSAFQRALSIGPARYLGRISYSLYLWHLPVFAVTADHTQNWSAPARIALAWLLAFAVASASYRFVERPALRLKSRMGRTRRAGELGPQATPAGV